MWPGMVARGIVRAMAPHATSIVASDPRREPRRATIREWLAIPEEERAELIDGAIIYQAMPGPEHGLAQGKMFALVDTPFGRRVGGGGRPGGWWFSLEVDMELAGLGCRPDLLGFRRSKHARLPQPDERGVVTVVPDWICEVLSPSTAYLDQGKKRRAYHHAGVEHYWLVDPTNRTLTVLERAERDYLILLVAGRDEVVRAAPFDAIEIPVGEIFGDDEEPGEGAAHAAEATPAP
jgi:Uma2 family endonuclease